MRPPSPPASSTARKSAAEELARVRVRQLERGSQGSCLQFCPTTPPFPPPPSPEGLAVSTSGESTWTGRKVPRFRDTARTGRALHHPLLHRRRDRVPRRRPTLARQLSRRSRMEPTLGGLAGRHQ